MKDLIEFDQQLLLALNGSDSIFWDGFWLAITTPLTWLFFYLALLYTLLRSYDWRQVLFVLLFIGLAILLADQVASGICKPYFHRFRPSHEPLLAGKVQIVNGHVGGRYGFMSSHAANGFAICTFISLLFRYRWVTMVGLLYACITSFSRIYLGLHYPGDILCGGLWGVISGALSYAIYSHYVSRRFQTRKFYTNTYTSTGISIEDASVPVSAFFFTLCCSIIYAVLWASKVF